MIRKIVALIATSALVLTMMAPAAFAQSPSQQECEEQGGTFTRERGTVTCVIVTEEEGKNPRFTQETTTTQQSQGTLQNEPQYEETEETQCPPTNPGNSCPPGQFR